MLLAEAIRSAAREGTLQQLIDNLPQQIAILDETCTILAVNPAWRRVARDSRYPREAMPGDNYRLLCARRAAEGFEHAAEAGAALDDIVAGKTDFWQLVYDGGDIWGGRTFQIGFRRISHGDTIRIVVTRFDLTEIVELRRGRDELGSLLLQGQDRERQRLARELHDSTSQLLTVMALVLGRLENLVTDEALRLVLGLRELLQETSGEIRAISFLALPPSLDRLGFVEAMSSLVEGYARRTGLEASLEIQGTPISVSDTVAFTFYRVAQEALSNVIRHAEASRVRVHLHFRRSAIHLAVADDGIGIVRDKLVDPGTAGVGLASMRSRLAEVAGRLSLFPLSPGTAILATVPLARASD